MSCGWRVFVKSSCHLHSFKNGQINILTVSAAIWYVFIYIYMILFAYVIYVLMLFVCLSFVNLILLILLAICLSFICVWSLCFSFHLLIFLIYLLKF